MNEYYVVYSHEAFDRTTFRSLRLRISEDGDFLDNLRKEIKKHEDRAFTIVNWIKLN